MLVTRPREQCEKLARLVREAGGEALIYPTLEIGAVTPSPEALSSLAILSSFDVLVFVSGNAVEHGWPWIRDAGGWPAHVRVAAVGPSTAQALHAKGVANVLMPSAGADSEALLALPELREMHGQRVLIFRGVGGRELLATTLRDRGAEVTYVECYQRMKPTADPRPLQSRLRAGDLDAVTAASSAGLTHLVEMVGPELFPQLLNVPLFVVHANIARAAEQMGFRLVRVSDASDEGLVRCIMRYFACST